VQGSAAPAPSLFRDSERPGEPITAGLAIGEGPGPGMDFQLTTRDLIEAAFRKFPNEDMAQLLRSLDE
jgi:hypothetical protein